MTIKIEKDVNTISYVFLSYYNSSISVKEQIINHSIINQHLWNLDIIMVLKLQLTLMNRKCLTDLWPVEIICLTIVDCNICSIH